MLFEKVLKVGTWSINLGVLPSIFSHKSINFASIVSIYSCLFLIISYHTHFTTKFYDRFNLSVFETLSQIQSLIIV